MVPRRRQNRGKPIEIETCWGETNITERCVNDVRHDDSITIFIVVHRVSYVTRASKGFECNAGLLFITNCNLVGCRCRAKEEERTRVPVEDKKKKRKTESATETRTRNDGGGRIGSRRRRHTAYRHGSISHLNDRHNITISLLPLLQSWSCNYTL